MKTCELFRDHTVLSFEIFPPKPTSPEDTIYRTLDGLRDLPGFYQRHLRRRRRCQ